jgi:uncharacterized protein (TIGR00661 family)
MAGEGRGHAGRVHAMVEELRGSHRVVLFAPGDAYDLLAPIYGGTEVTVRRIPGLKFQYTDTNRLDYLQTGIAALSYVSELSSLVDQLSKSIEAERPDLVITDFEPALPRAAKRVGVPFVSLDHQHFLVTNDLSDLPFEVRFYAAWMGSVVKLFYWGQSATVVSSFYSAPLLPQHADTIQVGVLLRPEIRYATPEQGSHLLAYVRRRGENRMLEALAECGRDVHVYGMGNLGTRGRLTFCPIDSRRFAEDLACCAAIVCTAGNQLVGEAHYLGKPVLAFPEEGNYEQQINGHYLDVSGGGRCVDGAALDVSFLRGFLEDIPSYRAHLRPEMVDGNPVVLDVINGCLPSPCFSPPARPVYYQNHGLVP